MRRKNMFLIILIILFIGINYLISKSKNENKESIKNVKPIEFTEEIGDNGVGVLLDVKKINSSKNPLSSDVKELNKFSAQVLDKNDNKKLISLYSNTKLNVTSKDEFWNAFYTENKDIYSKIKYKVDFSVPFDDHGPNLMLGYVYSNGEFFHSIQKLSKNKVSNIYVKGKFNDYDMKIIKSIYTKAYNHKLNGYN
ncbi:hypothetical protein QJS64_20675 (plasmid) [Paraclostridium bifermentans]|uniref:Uncharacterized protein n=1 Tax=Paraclostridium bifermentans TaxID=1490 RepID=A0ABY8R8D2_PARBF|nr:hypothetical protein QJS64_20675 [Paraclostridium bifermentans]